MPKTQLFLHIFPPLSANQTCDPESVLHIVSGRIQDLACNRSFVSIEVECPGKGCFEENNFNDSLLVCRLNKTQYNSIKIRTETVSKSDLFWFNSDLKQCNHSWIAMYLVTYLRNTKLTRTLSDKGNLLKVWKNKM